MDFNTYCIIGMIMLVVIELGIVFVAGKYHLDADDIIPACLFGVILAIFWPITLASVLFYLPMRGIYKLGQRFAKDEDEYL